MGTDLLVGGHYHGIEMWEPGGKNSDSCTDFPIMLDGSHVNSTGFNASQLLLKDGKITCYGVSDTGEQKLSYELTAGGNVKTESANQISSASAYANISGADTIENTSVPTAYGKSVSRVLKGASADFGFITKPTVFDTGDTYTVAWATTEGKNSMGEVHLVYEGRERRFTDSEAAPCAACPICMRCVSRKNILRTTPMRLCPST